MVHDHPLRRWRKEHGITLTTLASKVGVTASHLSEIENWNNGPSLELAAKLSRETADENGCPTVGLDAFVAQTEVAQ